MKNLWFFIVFLCSICVHGQLSDREIIIKDNNELIASIFDKNYDNILDFTHPELYNFVSRDDMKLVMMQIFEGNEDIKMEFNRVPNAEINVTEISTLEDRTKYAFVTYPLNFTMKVKAGFSEEQQAFLKESFKKEGMMATFKSDKEIDINKVSLSIAINSAKTDYKWKYLNHDENNPFYPRLLPKEILTKAIEYNATLIQEQNKGANNK